MKDRRWVLTVLSVLLVVLLSAALVSGQSSARVQAVDDLGRLVTLDKLPERIISLAPSNTEILFALGLDDRIVGVTEYCDYPPQAQEKEVIGGFTTPDMEKIVALSPDLILATDIHKKEVIPNLEKKGLTVAALEADNLTGILYDLMMVGKLTGKENEAVKLIARMQEKIETITDKTKNLTDQEKPRVFWVTWPEPIWTTGKGTVTHELIVKSGGENLFQDLNGWKKVDMEAVIARDPQIIIAPAEHGVSKPAEWAKEEPRLKVTAARQNNRICTVETNLVERMGPRIVEGLEKVAACIHPEIFGDSSGDKG